MQSAELYLFDGVGGPHGVKLELDFLYTLNQFVPER